jgi:hypothetical protein
MTVCRVARIEHDTVTVTEPSKNNANIVQASRTPLACAGELRLLNRSTFRLACELQKIKTQNVNSYYGLERCSEAQVIKRTLYYS